MVVREACMTVSFDFREVPENERALLTRVQDALTTLGATASSFASAILAYVETERLEQNLPTFEERVDFWREHGHVKNAMAQRGAMLIYDFHRVQQRIQSLAARSEWVVARTDRAKLKRSNKEFLYRFPHFASLRNSAAHTAETLLSDEFQDQRPTDNAIHGLEFGVPVLLAGALVNGNYFWTVNDRHLSYEVSVESAEVLTQCSFLFEHAFKPLLLPDVRSSAGEGD